MKKTKLNLKVNSYDIVIGDGLLKDIGKFLAPLKLGSTALIVTNPIIDKYHGQKIRAGLKSKGFDVETFLIPSGEKSKSADAFIDLTNRIAQKDVLKRSFMIAFGGGVVGDLAGFVASVYKRGIPYIQVPTTLLAQVDSSIGGKVAIDMAVGKNLIGSFHHPKLVLSDTSVLKTLDMRQIRNGLAEVIKYGVIRDARLFDYVQKNYAKLLASDLKTMTYVVERSSQIKANVVLADEKETKGIRTILNFGHTIGHAIEAAAGFDAYHHGEAIALGMRIACEISRKIKLCSREEQERLNVLLSSVGLPEKIERVNIKKILDLMQHDKKFIHGKNRFVLLEKIGKVTIQENLPHSLIQESIQKYAF
jgi:3-dehydroquinate synthase